MKEVVFRLDEVRSDDSEKICINCDRYLAHPLWKHLCVAGCKCNNRKFSDERQPNLHLRWSGFGPDRINFASVRQANWFYESLNNYDHDEYRLESVT